MTVALLAVACGQPTPAVHKPPVPVETTRLVPEVLAVQGAAIVVAGGVLWLEGSYVPPAPPAPVVATAPVVDPPPALQPVPTHGPHSYAWWEAIATCESGNTDAPRTGYYGLEADRPVGGMSKADQLAWAEQIDASSGDGAWGCSPVAWQNVPGG
jgi:hypothetical protein